MFFNFSDGKALEASQQQLQLLLNQITMEELNEVRGHLYKILTKIGKKNQKRYMVDFVDNIPLQISQHHGNLSGPLQYGVHTPFHIKVIKMSNVLLKKGTVGELIILAHECGHAIMGHRNQSISILANTRTMEKATDEALKMNLPKNKFPNFYEMYRLCRDTHHYKTKEGDFKTFFSDIISVLEKEWEAYKKLNGKFNDSIN